jgi:glycosyl transferase family 4
VRILQLTDLYAPVIGGLERHVATLSAELQRLGHVVTVVTLRPDGLPAEEVIDGVRQRSGRCAGSSPPNARMSSTAIAGCSTPSSRCITRRRGRRTW